MRSERTRSCKPRRLQSRQNLTQKFCRDDLQQILENLAKSCLHFILMKVQLRFERSTENVFLSEDSNLELIQKEVEKLFKVPPEQQKIIFRGTQLKNSNEKLKSLKVNDGSKLLILQENVGKAIGKKDLRKPLLAPRDMLQNLHFDESIIGQGPPKGAIKGYTQDVMSLPESPFVVRFNDDVWKLSVETDAIFLLPREGEPRRIFFSNVRCIAVKKIFDELYSVLVLITEHSETIYIYFLPCQYVKLLIQTISA